MAAPGTSVRDRVEAALEAIARTQPSLNAFTAIRAHEARAEAEILGRDTGRPIEPLHGMPVAVKDLFDVAGLATTGGCAAYRDRIAHTDAAVVSSLRAAGAVIVAKTNQHELGAGATGLVSCFGPVANPWDLSRIAGGSSSGSAAAVAAGVVPLAIGSDTGGSIRIPASFCGVTGLRPTPGRISLAGAQPMSPGYDTAGPIARTARECADAFAALTGAPRSTLELPAAESEVLAGLRIGLPRPYFTLVHRDTRDAVEHAATVLQTLGAQIEWLDEPHVDDTFAGFPHVWADLARHHRNLWDHPDVTPEVAHLIDYGRRLTTAQEARSREYARQVRAQFLAAFGRVDVLLTPATPYPAPRADEESVAVEGGDLDVHRGAPSRMTVPVNESGMPAVAFPVGMTSQSLPLGAQLIGPEHSDERLLATVAAFQDASSAVPTASAPT